jgi:hypothetical protein
MTTQNSNSWTFNPLVVQIEIKKLWKIAVFSFALCLMGGFVVCLVT